MAVDSAPTMNAVSVTGLPLRMVVGVTGSIGLLVGSFLNVVIYRLPRGLSISKPRSFCPSCSHQLAWWENIPVLSWISLRGQCRACHGHISLRYPIVEAAVGLLFTVIAWHWQGTGPTAGYCCLAASMVALLMIEADGQRPSSALASVGTGCAFVLFAASAAWADDWRVLLAHLAGTILGGAALFALAIHDRAAAPLQSDGGGGLLVAGCWMGGLSIDALFVACVGGVFAFAVSAWALSRQRIAAGSRGSAATTGSGTAHGPLPRPFLLTPLTIGLATAMLASLMARA